MHVARFGYGMMGGGPRLLFFVIGFFIFLAIVAAVVVLVVKLSKNKSHPGSHSDGNVPVNYNIYAGKALEILNERYVKGEIDDEEYVRKKAELMKQ